MTDQPAVTTSEEPVDHVDTVSPAKATADVVKNPNMEEVQPGAITEGSRTDGKLIRVETAGNKSTYTPPVPDAIKTGDLGTQVTKGTSRPRGTGN